MDFHSFWYTLESFIFILTNCIDHTGNKRIAKKFKHTFVLVFNSFIFIFFLLYVFSKKHQNANQQFLFCSSRSISLNYHILFIYCTCKSPKSSIFLLCGTIRCGCNLYNILVKREQNNFFIQHISIGNSRANEIRDKIGTTYNIIKYFPFTCGQFRLNSAKLMYSPYSAIHKLASFLL